MPLYATVARMYPSSADMPPARIGVCYSQDDCGLYYYNGSAWVLDSYLYEPIGGEVIFCSAEGKMYQYDGSQWNAYASVAMQSGALGISHFDFDTETSIVLPAISIGAARFNFDSDTNIVVPSMSLGKGNSGTATDVIGFGME